jgi:hypothetical protein
MKPPYHAPNTPAVIFHPENTLRSHPPLHSRLPQIPPTTPSGDVALTTPPKLGRTASQGVTAVGLGISNVHFDAGSTVEKEIDGDMRKVHSIKSGKENYDDDDYDDKGMSGGEQDDGSDEVIRRV